MHNNSNTNNSHENEENEAAAITTDNHKNTDDDDDLDDDDSRDQNDKGAKKQSMMEPEDEGDDPDGDIDGADAWEVKEIVGEKKIKKGKKRYTHYKIVWSGDYPGSWEVKSNIRAPDVVKAWEQKKKLQAKQSVTMITKRYCQLNMCVEPITKQSMEAEV